MRTSSALSNIKLLGLFNFFSDFRVFGPIMIIYFAQVSGSYVLAGTLLAIKMVSSAAFEIPTGLLSDRLRRVRVTLMGSLTYTAAIATYAIAPNFSVLVIGVVLEGLGRALFSGNNDALLWDSLKVHGREHEFHHWSGRVNAAFQIALASAALIGGLVAEWSLRLTFAITIVPQIASVVVALFLVEPKADHDLEPERPVRQLINAARYIVRHRHLRMLTLSRAVSSGASELGSQFQPAFAATLWPAWALGVGRAASHAMTFTGFWWAGRVIDRFGAAKANFGATLIAGVVGLLAYGKPTLVSPALAPIQAFMSGNYMTAQTVMSQQMFTDRERATMGSIGQFLGSLMYAAFSIAAGTVADTYGSRWALLMCEIGALSIVPVYWWLHRERLHAKNASATTDEGHSWQH